MVTQLLYLDGKGYQVENLVQFKRYPSMDEWKP